MKGHSTALFGWFDRIVPRLVRRAACNTPQFLCERLEEEWLADLAQRRGRMSQLRFALGCYWAATVISHDLGTVSVPASSSPMASLPMECKTMTVHAHRGTSLFSRRTTPVADRSAVCDINITPLIDVMLVLLVTLIVSLPIMTHAVKLNLPQAPPSARATPPEIINLDIDFDGTVVWNGTKIVYPQQLESYLRNEAGKDPQPEIHLHPDRGVKYDLVAKVLASVQRNRMNKMGFVNTGEYEN